MKSGFLRFEIPSPTTTRSGKVHFLDDAQFPQLQKGPLLTSKAKAKRGLVSSPSGFAISPYNFKIPDVVLQIIQNSTPSHADNSGLVADEEVVPPNGSLGDDEVVRNTSVSLFAADGVTNIDTEILKSSFDKPVSANANATDWSSLFHRKPRNAGRYVSKNFKIGVGDFLDPPCEVVDIGKKFWKNHLVGFFLDKSLPYNTVINHLLRGWNLKGKVKVIFDMEMLYFEFSCPADRARFLDSDPYIIFDKVFIITKWTPTIDRAREQVQSIRVWDKLTNIPSLLQPLEGLDWHFGHVGKLVCFDESTERRDRMAVAKALIEITPEKELPTSLPVRLSEHITCKVEVSYLSQPPICPSCKSFGHFASSCSIASHANDTESLPSKIPLRRPPPREWRVKAPVSASSLAPPPEAELSTVEAQSENEIEVVEEKTIENIEEHDEEPRVPAVDPSPFHPHVEAETIPLLHHLTPVTPSPVILQPVSEEVANVTHISDYPTCEVQWIAHDNVWIHASSMCYELKKQYFFKFISDDIKDLRCIYYTPIDVVLVPYTKGRFNTFDRLLLSDDNWNGDGHYTLGSNASSIHIIRPLLEAAAAGRSEGSSSKGSTSSSKE